MKRKQLNIKSKDVKDGVFTRDIEMKIQENPSKSMNSIPRELKSSGYHSTKGGSEQKNKHGAS